MTLRSKYGLLFEYLNLKQKGKSKAAGILWRPKLRAEIDKYVSNSKK